MGEQIGGLPSGCVSNIELSGLHSKGQHSGQPSGNGSKLQSGLLIFDPVQSAGLCLCPNGRKQDSKGHLSMTSEHSEGIILGLSLGFCVSIIITAAFVGCGEGTGDGSGVGLQSILSCGFRHSSGQQLHTMPAGIGMFLHKELPMAAQLTGRSFGLSSQHAEGH